MGTTEHGLDGESHPIHELAQVQHLRQRFVGSLERSGVAGEELESWKLMITELVNNAIEHGCLRPGDVVMVRWRIRGDDVELQVNDPGPCALTERDFDEATCDGFSETGRGAGLFLIRALSDALRVRAGANGGTEIEVHKRRSTPQPRGTEL